MWLVSYHHGDDEISGMCAHPELRPAQRRVNVWVELCLRAEGRALGMSFLSSIHICFFFFRTAACYTSIFLCWPTLPTVDQRANETR